MMRPMLHTSPDKNALERYRQDLKFFGSIPRALGWHNRKKMAVRYAALASPIKNYESVLDYGAGLCFLKDWLTDARPNSEYFACDPVPEFCNKAAERFPTLDAEHLFQLDQPEALRNRLDEKGVSVKYDHIVCCGVFTRYSGDPTENRIRIGDTVFELMKHANIGVHIDFLGTRSMDFKSSGDFHFDEDDALRFFREESGSSRIAVDATYLPYEFCVHIYRDIDVARPDNVYRKALD